MVPALRSGLDLRTLRDVWYENCVEAGAIIRDGDRKLEISRQMKGIDYVTEKKNTYRAFLPFKTPIRKIWFLP